MINGYVTFAELQIITGYSKEILKNLISMGLRYHELEVVTVTNKVKKQRLFNLEEVIRWLNVHIF